MIWPRSGSLGEANRRGFPPEQLSPLVPHEHLKGLALNHGVITDEEEPPLTLQVLFVSHERLAPRRIRADL